MKLIQCIGSILLIVSSLLYFVPAFYLWDLLWFTSIGEWTPLERGRLIFSFLVLMPCVSLFMGMMFYWEEQNK